MLNGHRTWCGLWAIDSAWLSTKSYLSEENTTAVGESEGEGGKWRARQKSSNLMELQKAFC